MAENHDTGDKMHFRCRTIVEVLGKPKEHVEDSIKKYTENIKNDSRLAILKEDFSEAKEQGGLWSKFVEIDLVIKGMENLVAFCFDYMPSSIEIEKPEQVSLTNRDISGFLNDLQSRLHNVDMVVKKQKGEVDFLKRNMNAMLHNTIMICLKVSSLSIEQLSQITGVEKKELEVFADKLIQENKIKKEQELYSLA